MTDGWLSIRVELVSGNGQRFWPRPGRIFLASPQHTFAQLANAIDNAFGRWDRAHLHQFFLDDGRVIGSSDDEDDPLEDVVDDQRAVMAQLKPGEQFAYEFDFGDSWLHLCQREKEVVDPEDIFGMHPPDPTKCWGWGALPDLYGRRWPDDDGTGPIPADSADGDLPAIGPWAR